MCDEFAEGAAAESFASAAASAAAEVLLMQMLQQLREVAVLLSLPEHSAGLVLHFEYLWNIT